MSDGGGEGKEEAMPGSGSEGSQRSALSAVLRALALEGVPRSRRVASEVEAMMTELKEVASGRDNERRLEPVRWLTARVLAGGGEPPWRRYALGTKSVETPGEDGAVLAETWYRFEHVLSELKITPQKAGKLFLAELRGSLLAPDQGKASVETARLKGVGADLAYVNLEESAAVVEKTLPGEDVYFFEAPEEARSNVQEVEGLSRASNNLIGLVSAGFRDPAARDLRKTIDDALVSASETEVGSPKDGDHLQRMVALLARLLDLARDYAEDLVALLEHYLETAQRMAHRPRPLAALDRLAVDDALSKIDRDELLSHLGRLPVYLSYTTERTARPAVKAFQNEALDACYQRFWERLLDLSAAPPTAQDPPQPTQAQRRRDPTDAPPRR